MVKMVPADMRRAAAAWDTAREQVKSASPSDRVGDISTAMPGGASAQQVGDLAAALDDRFEEWCAGATQMGENFRAVADDHQATDQHAGDAGHQHAGALSDLGTWTSGASPSSLVNSGPAIFEPGAPASDRMANLIERLGKVDS